MNANWYHDPMGRYEGRYWDGDRWTAQVKDAGRLVIDPDWPPVALGAPSTAGDGAGAGDVAEAPAPPLTTITPNPAPVAPEPPPSIRDVSESVVAHAAGPAPEPVPGSQAASEASPWAGSPVPPGPDLSVSDSSLTDIASATPAIEVPMLDGHGLDPASLGDPALGGASLDVGAAHAALDDVTATSLEAPSLEVGAVPPLPPRVDPVEVEAAKVGAEPIPSAESLFATSGSSSAVTPQVAMPSFDSESPTRTVARLDESDDGSALTHTASNVADPDAEPSRSSSRRWAWLLGLAVLLAGLLVILWPRLFGGDDPVADDAPAAEVVEAEAGADGSDRDEGDPDVADTGDAPDDGEPADADEAEGLLPPSDESDDAETDGDDAGDEASDGSATDGTGDGSLDTEGSAMQVGSLEIVNGGDVLRELEAWHIDALAIRGEDLQTQCWLGEIGQAAVQAAHCGPVGTTDDGEVTFDLIPLNFEEVGPSTIRITPLLDAVTEEAVLAPGLTLVGLDGPIDASAIQTGPAGKGN